MKIGPSAERAARPCHPASRAREQTACFFSGSEALAGRLAHVQRFRVIVGVFLKYGYGDLAQRLPLPAPIHLPFRKTREGPGGKSRS